MMWEKRSIGNVPEYAQPRATHGGAPSPSGSVGGSCGSKRRQKHTHFFGQQKLEQTGAKASSRKSIWAALRRRRAARRPTGGVYSWQRRLWRYGQNRQTCRKKRSQQQEEGPRKEYRQQHWRNLGCGLGTDIYRLDEGVGGSGMGLFLIGGHWLKILPQNSKGAS
jgi:hypothetical protein